MIINTLYGPDHNGDMSDINDIHIRWREEGKRVEKTVKDFEPYCYVPKSEKLWVGANDNTSTYAYAMQLPDHQNASWMINRLEPTDKLSADGRELVKVILNKPWMARIFGRRVKPSFEADVAYEDRYLIDNVDEIHSYKMRKLFIDLEALQYRDGDKGPLYPAANESNPRDFQEINVIGAYDSFSKQRVQWCQHASFDTRSEVKEFDGDKVLVYYFNNEKDLLEEFVGFVEATDPDCILAWGMGFYDLPTLYYRLESCGIGAERLSPSSLGKHRHTMKPTFKGNQYRWQAQPVIGRLVISLDRLFERIYKDSKSANLPSNKLDVVGEKLFGRGKTDFRPDFYDADYDEFIQDYLYYNYRDVELMIDIEEKYNLIEGQQALQELAKCQFNATFYGSSYARVYFMRKAGFIQKTGWQETYDEDLQGAIVMDPEDLDSVGAHKNVCILDFAGLYPSMMVAYNTSWETKVKPGEERDDDIIGDGCRFRREPEGILPACVKELDVLRDEYKAKRADAANAHGKGSDEYRKWDDAQKTVKRLRATFYGLMGFGRHGYAWGDIDIARTITYGGRTALMRIKDECEKLGYPVIYGHTDSIFVKLGDDLDTYQCAEVAEELGVILTDICQTELKSDAVIVEPELIMDRFYLPRRNRYAGRIVWMPDTGETPFDIGSEPVDSRIKMQGLEAKHTNTAPIGREVQIEAMKMIWDDKSPKSVLNYVTGVISKVRSGEVPTEELIARARLGKWLPTTDDHYSAGATNPSADPEAFDEVDKSYANLGGNQKGAAWHNIVLANDSYPTIDRGDSFSYTFVKDGPTWIPEGGYVGFHELSQIKNYELDIEKIIEKNIIGKLDHIMYGIGMSNDMLRPKGKYDGKQLSMSDFQ
jgi:DNA polymerase elongation subunit (family B)